MYTIALASFLICTEFVAPLYVTDSRFRPYDGTEWARGEALVACLESIQAFEYGEIVYVCEWSEL
jgi:hypothetical protein